MSLNGSTILNGFIIFLMSFLLLFVGILREMQPDVSLRARINRTPTIMQWLILFIAIMSIIILGVYGPGYNPQEFLYAQF